MISYPWDYAFFLTFFWVIIRRKFFSFVGVLECSDNTGESTKGEKSFFFCVVSGV